MFDGLPVCGYGDWDELDGQVICRELGYPGLVRISKGSEFGRQESSSGYYRGIYSLYCNGDEERLEECNPTKDYCWSGGLAGIVCIPGVQYSIFAKCPFEQFFLNLDHLTTPPRPN